MSILISASFLFTVLRLVAWGYVAYYSIVHINGHTQATGLVTRIAFVALAAAGVAGAVNCFFESDWFDGIAAVGVALFLFANRKTFDAKPGPTA